MEPETEYNVKPHAGDASPVLCLNFTEPCPLHVGGHYRDFFNGILFGFLLYLFVFYGG